MTAVLLSQHSSNPLEVGSSDVRNADYRRRLLAAQQRRDHLSSLSSDDPINSYVAEDMKQYHNHLVDVLPTFTATKQPRNAYIDIDEDMDSDDLIILPPKTHPTGTHQVPREDNGDDEDHEIHEGEDPQLQGPGEVDEEMTIYQKTTEERLEIEEEIADLEEKVPRLVTDYKLLDRLGTGTFSSVYKAIDLGYHDRWDNSPWHGNHPQASSAHYQSAPRPPDSKVFVAVKRIYVTSSPERIKNEISIMEDCRGCRHISQLITAFRDDDQVVAIMPYQPNDDFRDYFRSLPILGIKAYFRCMFRALRDVHTRGIIHRDVKPANFLFDPLTGIGTLCDFGLASRMETTRPAYGSCFHTSASLEHPHGRVSKNMPSQDIKNAQQAAKFKSKLPAEKVGYPEKDTRPVTKANRAGTRGFRAPEVLLKCGDQTGAIDVWAAGMILLFFLTHKFPLFQSNDDIEALMEIATVVGYNEMENVATLHSRTFSTNVPTVQKGISWREFVERQNPTLYEPQETDPRYYPNNDEAYRDYMRRQSDQNSHPVPPSSSSTTSSPPSLYFPRSSSPASGQPDAARTPSQATHQRDVEAALDLAEKLMNPYCVKRITPRQALAHPFLRGEEGDFDEAADDDEFVPHRPGEGVCGGLHFVDDVTEAQGVKVPVQCGCGPGCEEVYEEVIMLEAGQGMAIGRQPCEFHHGVC
ncbi:kinase-like protein [Lyophyllum atratum]|nr:kinase-like protein [Lyophyllum atratum]